MIQRTHWSEWEAYQVASQAKRENLLSSMLELVEFHMEHCREYAAILNAHGWRAANVTGIEEIPFLPVRLFKQLELRSCPIDQVVRTLTSSGTSQQTPSQVYLDKETSIDQSKALIRIFQSFLGVERFPMLVLDVPSVIRSADNLTARGAGVRGMSVFGRNMTFALREDYTLDDQAIADFLEKYGDASVLVYGSTAFVWKYFVEPLRLAHRRLSIPNGVLIHTGGWKKLIAESVDNHRFKEGIFETCCISRVHNFYGMAEQVGSVFVECEKGVLHSPSFADVIVRRASDWRPLPLGEQGVVQVLSALPRSYPGHSLLTEDLGTIVGEDDCDCGRLGKTFQLHGRVPRAELRGCGDAQ